MFLKFLEKIGRKKVVLDRGPSHPNFKEAKPWMNRYYVLMRYRPKWFPFNILIHEMLACLLYTSPSPRDVRSSRMPSSA